MDNQIALAEAPELLWLLQQILWALRAKLCGSGPNPTYGNPWVVVPEDDRATASTAEPSRPSAAAAAAPAATTPPVATPEPVDTRRICYNTCLFCDSRCCRGEEVGHKHCRCRVQQEVEAMKRLLNEAGTIGEAGDSSSVSGAVDASAFDTHLASCVKLTSASHYKPTWELVSGGPPLLHEYSIANRMGPLPMLPEVCDMEAIPHAVVDTQVFKMRRTVDSRSWEDKLNSHLVAAIRKWAGIILIFPLAFDIGRNFVVNSGTMANSLHETLYDVFAGKSAGTLHNRANPMIRFIAWCRQNGYEPLPLDEEVCYRFALNSRHTAPTFLRSFLVSITLSFYVLGLIGGESCFNSKIERCSQTFVLEKEEAGATRSSVEQVRKLELLACGDIPGGGSDRLAAWFFLLCIYMRARYSDGLNMDGLFADCPEPNKFPLYVSLERKTMNLPMVACRRGVSGKDWSSPGLVLRQSMTIPMETGYPLLPAPTRAGSQRSPLSAGQAGMWLRGILLGLGEEPDSLRRVGTHSCKATCLSWCSKNKAPIDVRRALGYHSTPGDKTALVYSRDSMAGPLCYLQDTIDQVSAGTFKPDCTRSGYHVAASASEVPGETSAERFLRLQRDADDDDHESGESEELETDSSSEDSADEEFQEHDLSLAASAENEVVPAWSQFEADV